MPILMIVPNQVRFDLRRRTTKMLHAQTSTLGFIAILVTEMAGHFSICMLLYDLI